MIPQAELADDFDEQENRACDASHSGRERIPVHALSFAGPDKSLDQNEAAQDEYEKHTTRLREKGDPVRSGSFCSPEIMRKHYGVGSNSEGVGIREACEKLGAGPFATEWAGCGIGSTGIGESLHAAISLPRKRMPMTV